MVRIDVPVPDVKTGVTADLTSRRAALRISSAPSGRSPCVRASRVIGRRSGGPGLCGGGGGRGWAAQKHSEAGYGLWTACGQRRVDSQNSQTTPATTSTSSIRQLLGAADAQTAHHATSSTAPTHQLLGSANTETTPARAPAAAADRKQRPDATCEGKNG